MDYRKAYIKFDNELPLGVKLEESSNYNRELNIDSKVLSEVHNYGENFTPFTQDYYNSGIYLYIPENTKIAEPIKVEFAMDDENSILTDRNIIIAESGSEVTIVFDYTTNNDVNGLHNGITTVEAKENSIVNIIKLQRANDLTTDFDTNIAFVKCRGKVNWISLELGSNMSSSNFTTFLQEASSESTLRSAYLGDGSRVLDLEYSMIHQGPRSISNIESRGALMDRAKKKFIGNLDFRRGAKGANGEEGEYVILLDPTVKSDSIPALLTEEDDVQGAHAASAGQIDKNKLFYLMSRGLSERESKKLIIEANFRPIIDYIPFEDLRDTINSEISRRLVNA